MIHLWTYIGIQPKYFKSNILDKLNTQEEPTFFALLNMATEDSCSAAIEGIQNHFT